jgi:protein-disulfide isomerase
MNAIGRIGLTVLAIAALAFGLFVYQSKSDVDRTETTSNAGNLVRFHSPTMGPVDAKVVIVEFLDPSCEACRAFHPIVKSLMRDNEGKVRLVVRYAPFHRGSDVVVKILEAAKKQGLFWQTLDAVFESQPVWADHHNPQVLRVWDFVGAVGLDVAEARREAESPAFAEILKTDTADLLALKVERTPTFFINGKPLPAVSEAALRAAVNKEIEAMYR